MYKLYIYLFICWFVYFFVYACIYLYINVYIFVLHTFKPYHIKTFNTRYTLKPCLIQSDLKQEISVFNPTILTFVSLYVQSALAAVRRLIGLAAWFIRIRVPPTSLTHRPED